MKYSILGLVPVKRENHTSYKFSNFCLCFAILSASRFIQLPSHSSANSVQWRCRRFLGFSRAVGKFRGAGSIFAYVTATVTCVDGAESCQQGILLLFRLGPFRSAKLFVLPLLHPVFLHITVVFECGNFPNVHILNPLSLE